MRTLASVGFVLLLGAGVAVAVIWVQESKKQREREAELVAQSAERARLASCVADKASDAALREILIGWYQPKGLRLKQLEDYNMRRCAELSQQLANSDDRKRMQIQLEQKISCISDPVELSRQFDDKAEPNAVRVSNLLIPLLNACGVRAPRGYVMPEYMSFYTFVSMDLMDQPRFRVIHDALMAENKAIMRPFEEAMAKRVAEQDAKRAKESDWLFKK